jgi:hypothetical protein
LLEKFLIARRRGILVNVAAWRLLKRYPVVIHERKDWRHGRHSIRTPFLA